MTAGTATRTRLYRCEICGARLQNERWVYSQNHGVRYCHPNDWAACEARSLKLKAKR